MRQYLTWEKLAAWLRRLLKPWLLLAAAAVLLVFLRSLISAVVTDEVTAVIGYSYDGIETGMDPMGNRFDPYEVIDPAVLSSAAEAAGLDGSEEAVETLRGALTVTGSLPNGAIGLVSNYRSIYSSDGSISSTSAIRTGSYYPSRYTIRLSCSEAGLTKRQGAALLEALLGEYETYFYQTYGYNASVEQSVRAVHYEDYDYENAVDVLDTNLQSLQQYIQTLADQDFTRFTSTRTGHSFSDLLEAIDTLRTEDLEFIASNIEINNVTRDRQELVNYYQYKIDNAVRSRTYEEENLAALNSMIETYEKTHAVVFGAAAAGTEGEGTSAYEVTQRSEMYDSLISQRITSQTAISQIQEQINFYQSRVDRLTAAGQSGNAQEVEDLLSALDSKLRDLLTDTNRTVTDYFATVRLKRAVQVVAEPDAGISLSALVKRVVKNSVIFEIFLFGLFVLFSAVCAMLPEDERRPAWLARAEGLIRSGRRGARQRILAAGKH